jgi:hypothetical protein
MSVMKKSAANQLVAITCPISRFYGNSPKTQIDLNRSMSSKVVRRHDWTTLAQLQAGVTGVYQSRSLRSARSELKLEGKLHRTRTADLIQRAESAAAQVAAIQALREDLV